MQQQMNTTVTHDTRYTAYDYMTPPSPIAIAHIAAQSNEGMRDEGRNAAQLQTDESTKV